MSKFTEFHKKAAADEAAKKEMTAILGDKPLNEATDEELAKVGEVAKKLGVDITAEEMKAFVSGKPVPTRCETQEVPILRCLCKEHHADMWCSLLFMAAPYIRTNSYDEEQISERKLRHLPKLEQQSPSHPKMKNKCCILTNNVI